MHVQIDETGREVAICGIDPRRLHWRLLQHFACRPNGCDPSIANVNGALFQQAIGEDQIAQ